MKGTIVKCLKELIETKYGKDKWATICEKSSYPANTLVSLTVDIEDATVMKLFENTYSTLGITMEQAADAFGDYWINVYSPKIYKSIFSKFKSAREFILGMDDIHIMVTKTVPNARPPRFTYNFTDDKTLVMTYDSSRNLIVVLMGLVRGLGRYFNENLMVSKIDDKSIKIVFS